MARDEESVRLQTDVSEETYSRLQNKAPVMANAGKSDLLRHVIEDWLRRRDLEEAQAGFVPESGSEID